MKKIIALCGLLLLLVLAGCDTSSSSTETPPNIPQLLATAADNMVSATTFQLEITQSGTPHVFALAMAGTPVDVNFRRAIGQLISPDEIYATASVIASNFPLELSIYGKGADQWFNIGGIAWINGVFAEGFDPRRVVGENSGFRNVLTSLQNVVYVGTQDLIGVQVHHITGIAEGVDITSLLVGMITFDTALPVDIYIRADNNFPIRVVITQPDTATEETPNTQWTVDVFDFGGVKNFTPPTGA